VWASNFEPPYLAPVFCLTHKPPTSILPSSESEFLSVRTQSLENSQFGITEILVIDKVWDKYLSWAKQHKKSWNKDLQRWQMHVQPHLSSKKMDTITTYYVRFVIKRMRSKRTYAPATIKHVIVLIKRVYNWAVEMDLFQA
jgi:hypothetical protein